MLELTYPALASNKKIIYVPKGVNILYLTLLTGFSEMG